MTRIIEVVPYDALWTLEFAKESQAIQKALGKNCVEMHHIGSTAVPGLAAKPVIDIIAAVTEIAQVDKANDALKELGYEAQGEFGMPFRRFFEKGGNARTHNLHVFEKTNSEIERHLKFRDWMRTHAEDKEAYGQLKKRLADQFSNDSKAYCLGKDDFITNIDRKTGFNGLRMVKALTNAEWSAVRHFRQFYFFDNAGLQDPYTWTFEHPDHVHFVLYQGAEIIGYAQLILWPLKRSAMRIIVVDEAKRNQQLGSQFLKLCEKWLKSQGYQSLHLEARPTAEKFYRSNGYSDMPFDEPGCGETEPPDIALGKIL